MSSSSSSAPTRSRTAATKSTSRRIKRSRNGRCSRDNYDVSRLKFVGRITPIELGKLLAATDLHIYLTVPFVLSWSMMDALSCGAVVLGSATTPVKEMIRDGENGLLADFFDADALAAKAVAALKDVAGHRGSRPSRRTDDQ